MSLSDRLREQRRLVILQAMAEVPDRRMGEQTLSIVVKHTVHAVYADVLRADLTWLEDQGLIRTERHTEGDGQEMWVGVLRRAGQEVAEGRVHPGVMRPQAR